MLESPAPLQVIPTPAPFPWAVPAGGLALLVVAFWVARSADFRHCWNSIPALESDFLFVGAAIIAGCFLAGYSNAYRAIFLLLALPGLLVMARTGSGTGAPVTAAIRWLPAAIVYNMWAPSTQHMIQFVGKICAAPFLGKIAQVVDWALHEIVWWWTATMLVAVLIRSALDSRAVSAFCSHAVERRGTD